MNNNSPFKLIDKIKNNISLSDDELKEFYPYLLNRLYYYYGKEKMSNVINILWRTPKAFQYKMFCIFFNGISPSGWIKSNKKKNEDVVISYLQEKYKISDKIATEYLNYLSELEKKEIRKNYE